VEEVYELMDAIADGARADATLGEMMEIIRRVFGFDFAI
jgi:NTP pyrophosphatase (non-canonical NTP hydrolase)